MRHLARLVVPVLLLQAAPAAAANLESLAFCTVKVFAEIHRSHVWSGKNSGACNGAQVSVEKQPDGVVVVASKAERVAEGWARVSFSAPQQYDELARPADHAAANRDILARAKRLSNCLKLIRSGNQVPACGSRGSREYEAGEESSVTDNRVIWLDDDGRRTVVEYVVGDVSETSSPPADLDDSKNDPLPPGTELWVPGRHGGTGGSIGK